MSKNTISSTKLANKNNNQSKKKTNELINQYEQDYFKLHQEITKLKNDLNVKFQELSDFKQGVPIDSQVRSKINAQARKLNNLRLRLPNFLIIGAQKGGTTWLHENLKRHPQIFLPKGKKELEFFSYYQKKVADYGLGEYLKHFNQFEDLIKENKPKAVGEATPSYFWTTEPRRKWTNPTNEHFNNRIPNTVLDILGPKIKLILCLRDPVERAVSAYFHHIRRGRISYESQRILDVGKQHGIIDMGFYSQHLDIWLKHFSLKNFKVLIYERDIKQNKQETIKDICQFLRVDYQLFPDNANLNKYHNRGLRYCTESDGVYLISADNREKTLVVDHHELQELRKIYYPDYLALQKTLNLDLSEYWQFR